MLPRKDMVLVRQRDDIAVLAVVQYESELIE